MKRLLAVLISLCVAAPMFAQSKTRYLISMRKPARMSSLGLVRDASLAAGHNVREFQTIDFIAADLTDEEASALRKSSDVKFLSPVVPRSLGASDVPVPSHLHAPIGNGLYSKSQTVAYGIDLVHARDIWPLTRGNNTVNVAVVDTGIDYNHPDLKDRYQGGYNTFTKTNDPKDDHGHGTHVAGIIAASDNNFGVVGVAPDVRIWSAKVLQANGSGTDETVIAGMDWVVQKKREIGGNWIVNLSLGAEAASDAEREMFQRVIDENILVVAAAGNQGSPGINYPAAYDQVLAISAIDSKSKIASFSSYGPGVAFAGPGVDVLSTVPVGAVRVASIEEGANRLVDALPLNGSSLGEVTGDTVYCGIGKPEQFPANTRGKIAIITRGELKFRVKVRNAIAAGATAMVIVPPVDAADRGNWTLLVEQDDFTFTWPVVVSSTVKDGQELIDNAGKTPITVSYTTDDYAFLSGTSMATPHVSGTAALLWSLAPDLTAAQLRLAMKLSADDLGTSDYDQFFGYGRIDALSGAKYIAPALFGLPPVPPHIPTRRRPSSPGDH